MNEPRFLAHYEPEPNSGCWLWTGAFGYTGYGVTTRHYQSLPAHRAFYEYFHGPIPVGLQIDHRCRNRACVNPAHLEAVTARENMLRSRGHAPNSISDDHCPRGHLLKASNVGLNRWRKRNRTSIRCRTCHAERQRERYRRRTGRAVQAIAGAIEGWVSAP